jgi:hypothetical protein
MTEIATLEGIIMDENIQEKPEKVDVGCRTAYTMLDFNLKFRVLNSDDLMKGVNTIGYAVYYTTEFIVKLPILIMCGQ